MDLLSIKAAFEALNSVISSIKSAKELLSNKTDREQIEAATEQAANQLRLAEVNIAVSLDYPICRCAWPPTIMTLKMQGSRQSVYTCSTCHNDFLVGQNGVIKGPYVE